MSEEIPKKKKSALQLVQERPFEELLQESRELANADEHALKIERAKLSERDLAVEKFLSKEKGGLKRYNERRRMHTEIERVIKPEDREFIIEEIPEVSD